MRVLVIDAGGTHIKVLLSGESEPRKFPSGSTLTAEQMVAGVKKIVGEWKSDAVSIGYPGDFEEDSMGACRTEWRGDEAGIEPVNSAVPHEEARHRAPRTVKGHLQ
jgi:predicted NBD/HSP70 family sugar kinase